MTYTYKLEEHDYHTHLLFTISKSSGAKQTRAKIRLLMTISLLIFSIIAYGNGSKGQSVYFLVLSILAFLLMPLYTRWSYKRAYLKHVKKYYQERMSEPTSIQFLNDSIHISDSHGESDIDLSELEEINEIEKYCFLKLKSGPSVIIPVGSMENGEDCKNALLQIAKKQDIQWNDERSWVWM